MQSSIALASGMLDAPFTSSAPSATIQDAALCTPASLSSRDSGTPVHSAQLLHGENQRPVHHSVDHETMLPGVDVGNKSATMCRRIEERIGRDHSGRIL